MTRYKLFIPVVCLAAFLCCLGMIAPLSRGLSIGGDDKFELCSAQLMARHPEMAPLLHNDQPWLHTLIIAEAFKLFGENAAIPRLLSLALTFALVLACWHIMGRQVSALEKILFLCVYFTSREIPILTASAMLEPVALALAVLAVACSFANNEPLPPWRAYLAGVLIGAAAQTKMTALIIGPAWLLFLWFQRKTNPLADIIPRIAAGFFTSVLITIAVSPTFSFESLWLSHWKAHEIIAAKRLGYGFAFHDVFNEWTILISVTLGIIRFCTRRSPFPAGTAFAIAWVATDFALHLWHRPWWSYYSIHFHIPVAILAAQGAGWAFQGAWNSISLAGPHPESPIPHVTLPFIRRPLSHDFFSSSVAVLASLIIACWCGVRLPLFFREMEEIHTEETVTDNFFIPVIRQYAGRAHWIYSNDEDIAFHSGVMQPPELILMTYKRTVAGDLNQNKIVEIIKSYKPEILLLHKEGELFDKRFHAILTEGKYVRVTWAGNSELWISPQLHPVEAKRPEDIVRSLGL